MQRRKTYATSLDIDLINSIDEMRGMIPRSRIFEHLLELGIEAYKVKEARKAMGDE